MGTKIQNIKWSISLSLIVLFLGTCSTEDTKPNIVIFLADDLGMGDIGCFGDNTLRTPHVDSICTRGARLSQHTTAAAMCSPSRAAFLTSRMPVRTGFATQHRVGVIPWLASPGGIPANETTFPKLLQQAGYNTALIGKWHLGISCEEFGDHCHHPNNHGFDYFFGLPLSNSRNVGADTFHVHDIPPRTMRFFAVPALILFFTCGFLFRYVGRRSACFLFIISMAFPIFMYCVLRYVHVWNSVVMRNGDVVEQPVDLTNMTPRLVNEGIRYLEQQKPGQPFLLFMSWVQVHTALDTNKGRQSAHGPYGDEVEDIDWSVGEILSALDKFRLMDNTIVYFSSDNGGRFEERHGYHGYRTGGYNGPYRGHKCQGGQDGGVRVPSTIMWPNHIPAGSEVAVPTSQMDLFPTLLTAAGVQIPKDRILDGVDLGPLLTGKSPKLLPHKFLFHYCGVWLHSVRYIPRMGDDVYKVYYYWPKWTTPEDSSDSNICSCKDHHTKLSVPKVTNVGTDPRETSAISAGSTLYQQIMATVAAAVQEHKASLAPVPNQLTLTWSPRLQPCCNPPTCVCSEDKENALNYRPPWDRK